MFPNGVMNVVTAVITAQRTKTMKHFTIDSENNITFHASRKAARETGSGVFSTEEQFADLIGNDNQRLLDIWNSLPGVKAVTKFANRKTATERIWRAIQSLGGPIAPAPEPEAPTEIAVAEPVAQPQPKPASESAAPPAVSEPSIPAAEQQPEPAAASQQQEPSVAPVEAAQQTTPFDDEAGAEPQATSEPAAGQPETAPKPETQQNAATPTAESETVANVSAQAADVAPKTPAATKKATRSKKAPVAATNASVPREGSKTSRVIAMLKREGGATLEEIMAEMGWLKHTTRAMLSAGGSLTKKHGLIVISEKVGDQRRFSIKA